MRGRPIIVPHLGQDGRFVAIDAGVASWNLSMSLSCITWSYYVIRRHSRYFTGHRGPVRAAFGQRGERRWRMELTLFLRHVFLQPYGYRGGMARFRRAPWLTFEGAKPTSEIRRAQLVGTFAGAHVNLHGGCVYQVAVRIERSEKPGFVASNARLDPPQRIFVDEKCSFHRAVMPPKPHGPSCRVIGAALIGKIERHGPVTLLESNTVGADRPTNLANRSPRK